MALWQIFDKAGVAQPDYFDDGLAFMPDEDGFSTEAVEKHAASLGKGCHFALMGVPNWHARIEAEQQAAAEAAERAARETQAKAQIAALIDPEDFAREQARSAIKAHHAELAQFADDDQKASLDQILLERLAALEPID